MHTKHGVAIDSHLHPDLFKMDAYENASINVSTPQSMYTQQDTNAHDWNQDTSVYDWNITAADYPGTSTDDWNLTMSGYESTSAQTWNLTTSIANKTSFEVTVLTSPALFLTRLIVQTYLVPVVVSCGVIGNFFNIIVLLNPKMRTSTNVYLLSLAVCDTLYLIFCLTLSFFHCSNKDLSATSFQYIPYARVFSDLFGNTAVWLTVCFTLERFIAVRFPMQGKAWCTVKKAKIAISVIFIFCLINTVPEIFETKIVLIQPGHNTKAHFECRSTEFAERQSYQIGYYWWFVTVFTFAPLLLLSIFNTLLIRSVWRANKNRQLLANSRVVGETQKQCNEQQKVTTMLIAVVVIFIFCQTPQAVLLIYRSYLRAANIPYPFDLIKIAGNVCNFLVMINASVNFLLYSYFSSKFRRTFKKVLCSWKKPWRSAAFVSLSSTVRRKSTSTTGTTLTSSSSSTRSRRTQDIVVHHQPLMTRDIEENVA